MSVSISFDKIVKKYGENTIIPELTLSVRDGEFFTLLGPSGCGKTTLLRMVAGFNTIEDGTIAFGEQVINNIPPAKRNIGMVFQNYAVFPHMTVRQNVAFGLTNRTVSKDEINRRVDAIMDTVHIREYASRLPERLSGGQQQRVALARAIVVEPNVLLMDEPLSNLDAKLRLEMRNVIRNIQNSLGITTIYVTHDQEEAMAVSDRIAVMSMGVIQQVGAPKAIYQRPSNLFVANFIGRSNTLDARLLTDGSNGSDGQSRSLVFGNGYRPIYTNVNKNVPDQTVKVAVRPEEFIVRTDGEGITGTIQSSIFLGLNTTYFIKLYDGTIVETVEESSIDSILEKGTPVSLTLKLDKINVFREDGEANLTVGGSPNE
ncbi:Fe(3+) ions import ATP-binding protein FbpC [Clostridia bacterium]|nr:Fe(3+) ions import ATP-binding protein FbpC [Clostridia bacterium]